MFLAWPSALRLDVLFQSECRPGCQRSAPGGQEPVFLTLSHPYIRLFDIVGNALPPRHTINHNLHERVEPIVKNLLGSSIATLESIATSGLPDERGHTTRWLNKRATTWLFESLPWHREAFAVCHREVAGNNLVDGLVEVRRQSAVQSFVTTFRQALVRIGFDTGLVATIQRRHQPTQRAKANTIGGGSAVATARFLPHLIPLESSVLLEAVAVDAWTVSGGRTGSVLEGALSVPALLSRQMALSAVSLWKKATFNSHGLAVARGKDATWVIREIAIDSVALCGRAPGHWRPLSTAHGLPSRGDSRLPTFSAYPRLGLP